MVNSNVLVTVCYNDLEVGTTENLATILTLEENGEE
jgi:hypothetical protein